MQRNTKPLIWAPEGGSDTIDGTAVFRGAMSSLSNMIPDPSTPALWQCRPAAALLANLGLQGGPFSTGFSLGFQQGVAAPGAAFISALKIAGNFAYGMVASNLNPGFDQPFCYNLANNTFVPVTGVTGANVPVSPPATGAWTPPIIDVIGSKVIVTHIGFASTANFFGWFDISNPNAPAWHAGNLTGAIQFTQVPTFVAQFGNRAYYIVNTPAQPAVVLSDILQPTNVTNATQVLTFGDSVPLTAIGQLRFYNQSGGIVQGLIVFKGVLNMYQVTGDPALNNLLVNSLSVATGTSSPLGIASTKEGLAFISPDGIRTINYVGEVSDAIGTDGKGITIPFIYAAIPSRVAMAVAGDVMRISTQNSAVGGTPNQEWWYDFGRKRWSGPHTFPASLIQPYGNTFIMTPIGVLAQLFRSDTEQSLLSTFVENGVQMTWAWQTAFLPDQSDMVIYSSSQGLLDMALSASAPPINISALDPNGKVIDSVQVSLTGTNALWGGFTWGQANWGAAKSGLLPRILPWHQPLVFARMQILASGQSNSSLRVGALRLRYRATKALADIASVAS